MYRALFVKHRNLFIFENKITFDLLSVYGQNIGLILKKFNKIKLDFKVVFLTKNKICPIHDANVMYLRVNTSV